MDQPTYFSTPGATGVQLRVRPNVSGDGANLESLSLRAADIPRLVLNDASHTPGSADCFPDLTGDCLVNTADLLQLIGAWGPCAGCPEDLDGDGDVDTADLLLLVGAWD